MFRWSLATAALVAMTTSVAFAQDWSGPYIGLQVGSTPTTANVSIIGSGVSFNPAPSGSVGGVLGGVNWQHGTTVIGLEAEYAGVWNGSPSSTLTHAPDPVINTVSDGTNLRVRARFGVSDGSWMFFVAGGWSQTSTRLQLQGQAPFAGHSSDQTHTLGGYNAGGGLEYAFSPHVIARVEYLYDHYGNTTFVPSDTFFSHRSFTNIQSNTYRAALNFRL
ncbi:MAG TPA: outer membrane beta-barrel protein [Candidatus Dormibacteraeota bacterium]|nr:outer membrane beta-barrel protein [Candidatus Dormibacteraeota bacterium]